MEHKDEIEAAFHKSIRSLLNNDDDDINNNKIIRVNMTVIFVIKITVKGSDTGATEVNPAHCLKM